MKLLPPSERRHPRLYARVRAAAGVWLLILTAILYGYHRGAWWGLLLLPAAALLFAVAFLLPRAISARTQSTDAK
jgi:peptidoglycan/LPS O-acetylase OafA/YrhL